MLNYTTPRHFAIAAVLAITTLGIAVPAQARSDVSVSIGIQVPGSAVVYPAPVYAPHRPVYMQNQPIYVQPRPVYVQPQPVYVQPAPIFIRPLPVVAYPPAVGYYYQPAPQWRHGHWKKSLKHGYRGNGYGYGQGRDRD